MSFTESLRAAMDTTDGREYIGRVKTVVQGELARLDPTAAISDTRYFNHSAIPDFVVTWPGERGTRPIYLRDSYESIVAAEDEERLRKAAPAFVALERSVDPLRELGGGREASTGTLVTDVEAVEVLGEPAVDVSSPVASLIRANFIRGARGHIDQAAAEALVSEAEPEDDDGTSRVLAELVRNSFTEDAALRITRTAALISLALNHRGPGLEKSLEAIGGQLSLAEVRHLLPYLLSRPQAAENRRFWEHVGGLMSLEVLETIRSDLADVDVSPLIHANLDRWEAHWAYLGVAAPTGDEDADATAPFWSFQGGRLGIDLGSQRLLVARNGQLVKAREASSSADWATVRGSLAGRRLARVALHGIRRSVAVSAEQSPDVRGDVEEITQSLDDHYFVSEVVVRVQSSGGRDGFADARVDFGGSIVHAAQGARLRDIVDIAATVLSYRNPASRAEMTLLLGDE